MQTPSYDVHVDERVALQIEEVQFRLGLKGYNVDDVDAFLESLLSKLKKGETISREDLAEKRFRKGLKGYSTQDVDTFLGSLAATLTA